MSELKTETQINISNYTEEKAKGLVAITKPIPTSENFVFMRRTYSAQMVDGVPTAVEGPPELANINRASIDALAAQLDAQETDIAAARAQLSIVLADMDALG